MKSLIYEKGLIEDIYEKVGVGVVAFIGLPVETAADVCAIARPDGDTSGLLTAEAFSPFSQNEITGGKTAGEDSKCISSPGENDQSRDKVTANAICISTVFLNPSTRQTPSSYFYWGNGLGIRMFFQRMRHTHTQKNN